MCYIIFAMPFISLLFFYFLPFNESMLWFIITNTLSSSDETNKD